MSVRIVAVHRYFWPDSPPYASLLRAIAERWASSGNDVEILSTQPSYKPEEAIPRQPRRERLHGLLVRRLPVLPPGFGPWGKVANVGVFPTVAFFQVLIARRPDVVMCSTSPPVVLAAALSLAARVRDARFVYHCMDIHPEIGAVSGEFRRRPVFRLLQRIDRATCRRSAAIVVLSEDMRDALLRRDRSLDERIVVLNNFDLPDYSARQDAPLDLPPPADGAVRIVFTGNVGRFQGLEAIVAALGHGVRGIELVFMGEGAAKRELQAAAADLDSSVTVRFLPHGSPAQARALMRGADLGLVSLTPGIVRYAYPSKTMTYLSEGLPLLVSAEADTDLVRTVVDNRIGYTVEPGDPQAIADTLHDIVERRGDLPAMAARAKQTGERLFGQAQALDRWDALLADVTALEAAV